MQSSPRKQFLNSRITLVLFVLVLIAAASLCVQFRASSMKRAAAATELPWSSLQAGQQVKLVVRLDALASDGADATNLEKETETRYRCTGERVRVAFGDSTPVVMGNHGDLRPSAVVHVTGVVGSNHELSAAKIVVLTPYVQVDPCQ